MLKYMLRSIRATGFLPLAALYNLAVFLVFYAIYLLLDFKTHFAPDAANLDPAGKLYFALMLHAAGNATFAPRTRTGRAIVALHVLATWAQILLVFVR